MNATLLRHHHVAYKYTIHSIAGLSRPSIILLSPSQSLCITQGRHARRFASTQQKSRVHPALRDTPPQKFPSTTSSHTPQHTSASLATASSSYAASPAYDDGQSPSIIVSPSYVFRGSLVPSLDITRPPALVYPPLPTDGKPWNRNPKYLVNLGRAYAKFYWTGAKHVWSNFKTYRAITARIGRDIKLNDAAKYAPEIPRHLMSYNEYELCLRTQRDVRKMIPFAIILAICGEFTPFVVLLLGARIVPGTCVIPKQQKQELEKVIRREQVYLTEGAKLLAQMNRLGPSQDPRVGAEISNKWMILYAYNVGLIARPYLFPALGQFWWSYRTKYFMALHCDELLSTLALVQREGGWKTKSGRDMFEWSHKYALSSARAWTQKALEAKKDLLDDKVMAQFKVEMMPEVERVTKEILDMDSRTLHRTMHWFMAFNTPGPERADGRKRMMEIERILQRQAAGGQGVGGPAAKR